MSHAEKKYDTSDPTFQSASNCKKTHLRAKVDLND